MQALSRAGAGLAARRRPRGVHRRGREPLDPRPRDRPLQRPPDGDLPDGRRPGDLGGGPVGRAARRRAASGSATRAPSRPPPGRTRCSRSCRWPAGPPGRSSPAETVASAGNLGSDRRGHRADRRHRRRRPAGARRLAAGRQGDRHGAAAVRSGRPRPLRQGRLPARRRPRPPVRRRARRRRRRRRPPRLHHHRRPRGGAADQHRRQPQRLRGDGRGGGRAARLHVVGRRLRVPRRQPAAADRGGAAARLRGLLLLGAQGRARGRPRRLRRRLRHRGVRLPPLHRRRRRSADPDRDDRSACCRSTASSGSPAGRSTRSRSSARSCPIPGVEFQLVHTLDVAAGAARRGRGSRRARPLQPRRAGVDEHRADGARLRLVVGARPRRRGRGARARSPTGSRACPPRSSG